MDKRLNIRVMLNRPNERGFTLVEVMVTIIILAILTSVAMPSFRSFIASQRIKSAAFDITAMLTLTRSEAIKRNTNVTACPVNSDWTKGWTVAASTGCPATGTIINQQNAMPSGSITITCKQGTSLTASACNAIVYDSSGRSNNNQAIQIVSNGDTTGLNSRCITIDPSGRPNSKKGTC